MYIDLVQYVRVQYVLTFFAEVKVKLSNRSAEVRRFGIICQDWNMAAANRLRWSNRRNRVDRHHMRPERWSDETGGCWHSPGLWMSPVRMRFALSTWCCQLSGPSPFCEPFSIKYIHIVGVGVDSICASFNNFGLLLQRRKEYFPNFLTTSTSYMKHL